MQIRGKWDTGHVWIDDRELSPERSQALMNHSPTGFAWGYGGSGPAQLALALCADALDSDEDALQIYQEFKRRVVAGLPHSGDWVISDTVVRAICALLLGPAGRGRGI